MKTGSLLAGLALAILLLPVAPVTAVRAANQGPSGAGQGSQQKDKADDQAEQTPPGDSQSDEDESFLRRLFAGRRASIYERSHSSVKEAFRSVTNQIELGTVRVLCNDSPAALGAIVDAEGYVLTKASELKGTIRCETRNGDTVDARIVGLDTTLDLAMLKIDAAGLTPVEWSDAVPAVGSWVITTGLDDLPQSVGVVSVGPRKIGGGVLGVWLNEDQGGPKVMGIEPNSGAAKAGMKVNDLVLAVEGRAVATREALIGVVSDHPPGETIKLTVQRGEEKLEIAATLSRRSETLGQDRANFQNNLGGPLSERRDAFPAALQHDSVLRPAECGGPLADLTGRVVGLNIARAGRVVSYALPADVIRPRLPDLMSGRLSPENLKRRVELRQSVEQWTRRAEQLTKSLDELVATEPGVKAAAETDGAEPAAVEAWEKLQTQRTDLERARNDAQKELGLATSELEKLGG